MVDHSLHNLRIHTTIMITILTWLISPFIIAPYKCIDLCTQRSNIASAVFGSPHCTWKWHWQIKRLSLCSTYWTCAPKMTWCKDHWYDVMEWRFGYEEHMKDLVVWHQIEELWEELALGFLLLFRVLQDHQKVGWVVDVDFDHRAFSFDR